MKKLCNLSPTEEKILANIRGITRKALARKLGMEKGTLDAHIGRIKKKRADAKSLLARTNSYKAELYPKRKGE